MDARSQLVTDAERIIAESPALLERVKHIGTSADPVMPPVETKLERWAREANESDRARAAHKARMKAEEKNDQVNASLVKLQRLLEQYVEDRIKAERRAIMQIVAGGMGELVGRMRKQADEIE